MEEYSTSSPLPQLDDVVLSKPETMSFFVALEKVLEGKIITKQEWNDQTVYGLLTDGRLRLSKNGQLYDWIISDGDMTGNDWIILEGQQ